MEKDITQQRSSIVRQVMFPSQLFDLVKVRLEQLGISVPEYLRQLVIEDVKPLYKNIPTLNEDTQRSLVNAFEDIAKGDVKKFENYKEAKEFLDSLDK
jgi:hypothetical protein